MAILTHLRLGGTSSSGFKAWVCTNGAATASLETRLNGTSDAYVEQDSQAVDTGKGNTAVLTATGVTAATKYDYRIKVDGIVFTTSLTVTMPEAGGRFLIYVVADGHGDSVIDTVFEEVLNDYISS